MVAAIRLHPLPAFFISFFPDYQNEVLHKPFQAIHVVLEILVVSWKKASRTDFSVPGWVFVLAGPCWDWGQIYVSTFGSELLLTLSGNKNPKLWTSVFKNELD